MVNKTISLSREIFDKLAKEDNASALIERLLREHFKTMNDEQMTPEERQKRIALLKVEIEAAKKAEEIMNGKPL